MALKDAVLSVIADGDWLLGRSFTSGHYDRLTVTAYDPERAVVRLHRGWQGGVVDVSIVLVADAMARGAIWETE